MNMASIGIFIFTLILTAGKAGKFCLFWEYEVCNSACYWCKVPTLLKKNIFFLYRLCKCALQDWKHGTVWPAVTAGVCCQNFSRGNRRGNPDSQLEERGCWWALTGFSQRANYKTATLLLCWTILEQQEHECVPAHHQHCCGGPGSLYMCGDDRQRWWNQWDQA